MQRHSTAEQGIPQASRLTAEASKHLQKPQINQPSLYTGLCCKAVRPIPQCPASLSARTQGDSNTTLPQPQPGAACHAHNMLQALLAAVTSPGQNQAHATPTPFVHFTDRPNNRHHFTVPNTKFPTHTGTLQTLRPPRPYQQTKTDYP